MRISSAIALFILISVPASAQYNFLDYEYLQEQSVVYSKSPKKALILGTTIHSGGVVLSSFILSSEGFGHENLGVTLMGFSLFLAPNFSSIYAQRNVNDILRYTYGRTLIFGATLLTAYGAADNSLETATTALVIGGLVMYISGLSEINNATRFIKNKTALSNKTSLYPIIEPQTGKVLCAVRIQI